jgi:hypothetical protein
MNGIEHWVRAAGVSLLVVGTCACSPEGEQTPSAASGALDSVEAATSALVGAEELHGGVDDFCGVGDGDHDGSQVAASQRDAPPLHDPRFRAPAEPPLMAPGWQRGGGPATAPRRPVPQHVLAALEEYQARAPGMSAEDAARLKSELLGE